MKITIITVCFNEERNIAKTIESVLNQTSADFEYIVCDGKSTDRTIEIAESYKEAFCKKGVHYFINSEKDKGIYDGMNKGIDLASEHYIYFLNAGDWFCTSDIVEKIVRAAKMNAAPDVLYGDAVSVERSVIGPIKCNDEDLQESMICHQALFASTSLMKEQKFDLNYKIAADYKFILGLKLSGKTFLKVDMPIAYYSYDGVSTVNVKARYNEHAAIKELYGIPVDRKVIKKRIFKESLAQKIKNALPSKLWWWWSVNVKGKTILEPDLKKNK